jgi:2-isopropylmalate synthase
MAGAQRVEGTLLGNGERTGNMDIVVMAMNLYSQGIDPKLDLSDMDRIVSIVGECTQIDLHPRHPYCGDLVFTAFSGGHQDAIKKCLDIRKEGEPWEVAYLPIDPKDIGRTYQDIIRINSQSGKGGIAYVLETRLGIKLPRWLQIDFSQVVQDACDDTGKAMAPEQIWHLFQESYLGPTNIVRLDSFNCVDQETGAFSVAVRCGNKEICIDGNTRYIDAFVRQLSDHLKIDCEVLDYQIYQLSVSPAAMAWIRVRRDRKRFTGLVMGEDVASVLVSAAIKAIDHAALTWLTQPALQPYRMDSMAVLNP